MDDVTEVCRRFELLYSAASTERSHCQEVAEYIFPDRADFTVRRVEGEKRQTKVLDSTPNKALSLLAAGLHGMATNPASRWFSLRLADDRYGEIETVRKYLSDVEETMFAEMHAPGSAITTHLHELYMDYAAFGTACMFIGSTKTDRLLFQSVFMGEAVFDEDENGIVDTLIRKVRPAMTVRQCITKWGDDCSEAVRKLYKEGKIDEKVEVLHAVFPRNTYDADKRDPGNMPFASLYIDLAAKHLMQSGGFEEFPFAVPRWSKASGERWGRSPGKQALPDAKMLQAMAEVVIKAAQKQVDPPLLVEDDGIVGPVRTVPGGLNFFRGNGGARPAIQPLQTGGQVGLGLEMMQDVRNRIMEAFFVDQLQFAGDANMTATEVMQRTEERMRLLGPILGRMEAELLGPLITRVYGILSRLGRFPEQPEELDGLDWTVEYVSPIALAQRGQKVSRALSALQVAGQIAAATGDPSIMARVRGDKVLSWIFHETNADPDLLLTDDEAAQKEQMNSMAQAMGPAAAAADAFAKTGQGAKAMAEAAMVGVA